MGNKFLALQKSEAAKVAPDRAGILGRLVRGGESRYGIWSGNIEDISAWNNELLGLITRERMRL